MQIKRDYSHPFFREPKRHRLRNTLIAVILGLLLGLAVVSRWSEVEQVLARLERDADDADAAAQRLGEAGSGAGAQRRFRGGGDAAGGGGRGASGQQRLSL